MDFKTLRDAVVNREAEWDPDQKMGVQFHAMELGGEVGEALNKIKKLERERLGVPGSRATVKQAAEELADVIIVAHLVAMHLGVDLEKEVIQKFNKVTRKRRFKTLLPELPKKKKGPTLWIEEYKGCGCSVGPVPRKQLLNYCKSHGSDTLRRFQVPPAEDPT